MIKRISLVLVTVLLSSCNTAPLTSPPTGKVDISQILEEVNSAILHAIPSDPDFPALTSITLDLQVSTGSTVGASIPINVITVSPTIDSSRLHRVLIDFVPTAMRQPSSVTSVSGEEAMLTAAISALYQSVAHASPVYKLQRGSITLQCVLKAQGGVGLKLVPVSANVTANRQVTQILTINFGRDPNRFLIDGGGTRGTGGSSGGAGTGGGTGGTTTPRGGA